MNAIDFVKYLPVSKTSLAQTKIGELKPDRVYLRENDEIDGILLYGILSIYIFTGLILLLTLFKKIRANKDRFGYEKNVQTILQIPCKNCRFYSHNPYLKCATHPSIVLTEKAIECPDYCPKNSS
jgi:hypothetical protein